MDKYIVLFGIVLVYLLYLLFARKAVNNKLDARYLKNIIKELPDYCQRFKFNAQGLKTFKLHVEQYKHRLTDDQVIFVSNMNLDKFARLGKIIRGGK